MPVVPEVVTALGDPKPCKDSRRSTCNNQGLGEAGKQVTHSVAAAGEKREAVLDKIDRNAEGVGV